MAKISKTHHVTKDGIVKRNPPKTKNPIKAKLQKLRVETNNSLKKYVIDDILEYDGDDMKSYMEDVMNHGCQSGVCSGLIYYSDTTKFYDKYQEEIEDLLQENKDSIYGSDMSRPEFIATLNGSAEDLTQEKNLLAWFAYEETIKNIYEQDLGLEW